MNWGFSKFDTGSPLIGRFLGPRKKHLNRNPSYWRSFYGINLQIGDLRNQKSPFFAHFPEFSIFGNEKTIVRFILTCSNYLSQI